MEANNNEKSIYRYFSVLLIACCVPFAVFADGTVDFSRSLPLPMSFSPIQRMYQIGMTMTVDSINRPSRRHRLEIEKGTLDVLGSASSCSNPVRCTAGINHGSNIKLESDPVWKETAPNAQVQLRFRI